MPLKAALNHGGTRRPKRDRREAKRKHVQLATVDPVSGRPAVRTISFRGFLTAAHTSGNPALVERESCMLTFVTDSRAEKVRHLQSTSPSWVECCWWLDEAGVQFRVTGRALLASHRSSDLEVRTMCHTVWDRLTAGTRRTFTWPAPGMPRSAGGNCLTEARAEESGAASASEAEDDGDAPPLDEAHFSVLCVLPVRVDELRLGGRQRRMVYSLDDGAVEEAVQAGDVLASPLWWNPDAWRAEEVNP